MQTGSTTRARKHFGDKSARTYVGS